MSSNDVGESRIVENVSVLFKINSVIEDTYIVSCMLPSSLDEIHVSPKDITDTSDVVDALMESSAPITDEINLRLCPFHLRLHPQRDRLRPLFEGE